MENHKLGAIFSTKDVRDYKAVCKNINIEFPEEFELDMGKVKNQGNVSSCVAHSLSTVIEYFNKVQYNSDIEMSTGYIYGNRSMTSYKGEGMVTREALNTLRLYGDIEQNKFPYNIEVPEIIVKYHEVSEQFYEDGYKYKIKSYCKLETENDIKQALMKNGPVVISMTWYSDIKVISGMLTTSLSKDKQSGGHCMVLYGWNKDGWKIQNSWGTKWGNKGCAIVPYNIPIREFWTVVDDTIDDMEIIKPYSSEIGKIIAKFLNIFWKLLSKIGDSF